MKIKIGDKVMSTWCQCILEIMEIHGEYHKTRIVKEGKMIECKYSLWSEDQFTEEELMAYYEILTDMGKAIYED